MPNLFDDLPLPEGVSSEASPKGTSARSTAQEEQFSELLQRPGLRIERIVSTGQCSPPDFWYDQAEGEWILLLQGKAGLRFADESAARSLQAGDYLDIAPHRRHQVAWTAPGEVTIWLAVFYPA